MRAARVALAAYCAYVTARALGTVTDFGRLRRQGRQVAYDDWAAVTQWERES